jgi:hypothetical protein
LGKIVPGKNFSSVFLKQHQQQQRNNWFSTLLCWILYWYNTTIIWGVVKVCQRAKFSPKRYLFDTSSFIDLASFMICGYSLCHEYEETKITKQGMWRWRICTRVFLVK